MNQATLLKKLYCQSSFCSPTALGIIVESFINDSRLEECLIAEFLTGFVFPTAFAAEGDVLKSLRGFLTLILVLKDRNELEVYLPLLLKSFRQIQRVSIRPDHQLLAAYQATVLFLLYSARSQIEDLDCVKALGFDDRNIKDYIELEVFFPSEEIPHPLFRAELGTLWCLYGNLTGRSSFVEAAGRIAEWQKKTLDHNYVSLVGLLSPEGEASERTLLIGNYLLFNAVARSLRSSEMAFLAGKQLGRFSELAGEESLKVPCHAVILEACFDEMASPDVSGEYYLPSIFSDERLALAGSRSFESSAVSTLYGGRSGMGCYHYKDVKVINFGPQRLPLGDCSEFGLEGGANFLSEHLKTLTLGAGQYVLEGAARLPSHTRDTQSLGHLSHGGWMVCRQELNKGILSIDIKFQRLFEQNDLSFSFFVKCSQCIIGGDKVVMPRSLTRYSGAGAAIQLHGEKSILNLHAGQGHEDVQIIPLGGGDNFWGADFLIAYRLKDPDAAYSWKCFP